MKHDLTTFAKVTILAVILGFAVSAKALNRLSLVPVSTPSVEAEYKRLKTLAARLEKMPVDKLDREPHKSYIRRNKKDIVYSDPAGQWFVRADRFWNLAKRNRSLPIADEIAWTAANTSLPGECEGDMNCSLYYTNETVGEYLRLFPTGRYSTKALRDLIESVSALTGPEAGAGYTPPTEASEKAELQKTVGELKRTLARVSARDKGKAVAELDKLANRYK